MSHSTFCKTIVHYFSAFSLLPCLSSNLFNPHPIRSLFTDNSAMVDCLLFALSENSFMCYLSFYCPFVVFFLNITWCFAERPVAFDQPIDVKNLAIISSSRLCNPSSLFCHLSRPILCYLHSQAHLPISLSFLIKDSFILNIQSLNLQSFSSILETEADT